VLSALTLVPIAALLGYLRIARHWHWAELWLLCVALSMLIEGVFTVGLGELLFKPPAETRIRSFVGRFLRRLPALVFAIILRAVMVVGTLSIFAPGALFIPEAMLLEGASFGKALSRSRALSRHRGGSCYGIWIVRLFLPALGAVAIDLLLNSLCGYVLQLGHPTGSLWDDGGSGFAVLGALLTVPLGAAMRFLGYVDLRTRKEGWDIQLRFVALAEQSAGGRRRAA